MHHFLSGSARSLSVLTAQIGIGSFLIGTAFLNGSPVLAQQTTKTASLATPNEDEKTILEKLRGLRKLPDTERGPATRQLALTIRKLPKSPHQLIYASNLANLSTEGDFGNETLQDVATTLAEALQNAPGNTTLDRPSSAYMTLAQLVRYEKVTISLNSPPFQTALALLEAEDKHREAADFTLTDLSEKSWTLKQLKGKVVLVNFWATWCPPCRKEIPDLATVYTRFKDQGLIVLGISDEDKSKVQPFVTDQKIPYPILLDSGSKVSALFEVTGIPRSLIFDRDGKLVAQAIDARSEKQLLALLERAGLR